MRKSYILLLILIIASLLRLASITTAPPGLYPDEAMNGNNAVEALETGEFKAFYPENNGREGLFANIQAGSIAIFGNEPWALRIPSSIFGILTVLGIYFLTKELFGGNKAVALLAAFLLATSFWHINFSRIAFRAIMAPFFLVWASYYLLLALRYLKEGKRALALVILPALGGFILGLGFHSYIAYRAMPLIFIALVPFYWRRKEFYAISGVFLLFTIVATIPLAFHFIEIPADFLGRTTQISVIGGEAPVKNLAVNIGKTLGMFNVVGDFNWRHNFAGRPGLFWPVGILFLLGIWDATRSLARRIFTKRQSTNVLAYTFLFMWFGTAMLPVIISNEGLPHALRAILMIPPAIMLAAAGGVTIYRKLEKKIDSPQLLKVVTMLFLAILTFEAYNTYFIRWAQNTETHGAFTEDFVAVARQINELPNTTQKIVVVRAGGVIVRGVPMPAQTVMFLTDSFTESGQARKNITYVLPEDFDESRIPESAVVFSID